MIFKQELSPQNGRYTPLLCFHLGAGELLSNFHRIDADLIQQHATIVTISKCTANLI